MSKGIWIERGRLMELCERTGYSRPTVTEALKKRAHTVAAIKIRKIAIEEFGGIDLDKQQERIVVYKK